MACLSPDLFVVHKRRMVYRVLVLLGLLLAGIAPSCSALAKPTSITPALIAESDSVAPGDTVMLAIVMTPKAGWHGYWENPGDAGLGMTADWRLPKGVSVGGLLYPTPRTLTVQGIMNYVYEAEYGVLVPLHVDRRQAIGSRLSIRAHLEWLACTDEICVPEQGDVALDLKVGKPNAAGVHAARFDGFRRALPARLDGEGRFAVDAGRIRLVLPYPADAPLANPYFFPATDGLVDYGAQQSFSRSGNSVMMETAAREGEGDRLEGILQIAPGEGLRILARRGEVNATGFTPVAGPGGDTAGTDAPGGLVLTFLAAVLGGLLLNVMPCVFPILGLKALSLAKSGAGERAARRDALFYTLGSVLVCVALGALLLILRAGGEQVGWAFQLQDPRIVGGLLILMVAITANLAGLFELPTPSIGNRTMSVDGAGGSFWTGALAAFVATPCTGPFMAAALGAALVLPVPAALLLFGGLGFGLALPFLVIGYVPAARRWLPRPGPWLGKFRKAMAVPMGLTALALGWLLMRLSGTSALLAMASVAALLLALLVYAGRLQRRGAAAPGWMLGAGLAAALVAVIAAPMPTADRNTQPAKGLLATEAFSTGRLAALRSEGRPVFAYFTADWCLTCKANEAAAIERKRTAQAFARQRIVVLRGDFTRRDPAIAAFLAENGRSGVPLYIYYAPGQPPRILPQILTVDMLSALSG